MTESKAKGRIAYWTALAACAVAVLALNIFVSALVAEPAAPAVPFSKGFNRIGLTITFAAMGIGFPSLTAGFAVRNGSLPMPWFLYVVLNVICSISILGPRFLS